MENGNFFLACKANFLNSVRSLLHIPSTIQDSYSLRTPRNGKDKRRRRYFTGSTETFFLKSNFSESRELGPLTRKFCYLDDPKATIFLIDLVMI